MRNKTKTYILLATVICLWSFIGFKIVNTINPETQEVSEQEFTVTFNPSKKEKRDTFSIEKTNKDPFLGTLIPTKSAKRNTAKNTKKIEPEVMPNITYGGLVKQSTQQVFIVNIDNNQHLLKKGQTVQNVKLIKGNTKEIVVSVNNKRLTIPL
ncbi:hypothetical protein [uncultured Lacinutrix sp.]|uniref:hypothetical protein n=1 Tax=uncultured Lacinutrix sp. TaxID=574032 RepID=UPI00262243D5|nr:hypothetical protein [uncultured Lacinutrix sp.]